jgi:hypothetical protein
MVSARCWHGTIWWWYGIKVACHFKMPREQKVTFQGSVGKRSLHIQTTVGNMLWMLWEHFQIDNRLVDTMRGDNCYIMRTSWEHREYIIGTWKELIGNMVRTIPFWIGVCSLYTKAHFRRGSRVQFPRNQFGLIWSKLNSWVGLYFGP